MSGIRKFMANGLDIARGGVNKIENGKWLRSFHRIRKFHKTDALILTLPALQNH
jgi:hypothetical protein